MSRYRYRPGRYVEDSTKGSSLIHNPVTYKGDAYVQVWLDSRIIATLSKWIDNQGGITRFLSEVVKYSLEAMVDHLVETNDVEMIENTIDARDLIQRRYRVNLNPHNRGLKNLDHNIKLSEKRKMGIRGRMDSFVEDSSMRQREESSPANSSGLPITLDEIKRKMEEAGIDESGEMKTEVVKLPKFEVDKDGLVVTHSARSGAIYKEEIEKMQKMDPIQNEVKRKVGRPRKESDVPATMSAEDYRKKCDEIAERDSVRRIEESKAMKEKPDMSRVVKMEGVE